MNTITRVDFNLLAAQTHFPALSIYMPTHPGESLAKGDPVLLKNLLRRAGQLLDDEHVPAETIEWMVEPAWALTTDEDFWSSVDTGLAIFIAPGAFHLRALPFAPAESVMLGDRFHLLPLLRLIQDERFYLLALSRNHVRLFEGNRERLVKVEMPGTPAALDDALHHEGEERQLQYHSASRSGMGSAVFHGNGGKEEDVKVELLEFFHQIDRGVRHAIREEHVPLLMAGVEYLLPIYRRANHYPDLMDESIALNPDALDLRELHQRSRDLVAHRFSRPMEDALARLRGLLGTGRASTMLREVLPAVNEGRVEYLFVTERHVAPEKGHTMPEEVGAGEMNAAALETVAKGGTVFLVPAGALDGGAHMAALFRY